MIGAHDCSLLQRLITHISNPRPYMHRGLEEDMALLRKRLAPVLTDRLRARQHHCGWF